jgi:hypothetical protein
LHGLGKQSANWAEVPDDFGEIVAGMHNAHEAD